jgi:UDP-glucose 4-epimerase
VKILVTGGAGYIGSHMVKLLQDRGYTPIVLDNLSTGIKDRIKSAIFIEGDVSDVALIEKIHHQYSFNSVLHFAAFIQVGESTENPLKYYDNNIGASLKLLQTIRKLGVECFVFSSSASVYGEPQSDASIKEDHPKCPLNPYGQTKLMMEHILQDCDRAFGLKFAALRYFNVAGVSEEISLGKSLSPVTHLIPLVLQAASGRRPAITIYGNDYATPDGTCIRDYIHVKDLCEAHLLALQNLWQHKKSFSYNLGTGRGYSVQEVLETAKKVTGKSIPIIQGIRRPGDPARLVADGSLARAELQWVPAYSDLTQIIEDAWFYERTIVSHSKGYVTQ